MHDAASMKVQVLQAVAEAFDRSDRSPLAADPRIEELWAVYAAKHVGKLAGQATVQYSWKNLQPHFGHLTLLQFNQDSVDSYAAKRLAGRIGRKAKSVTVRREIAYLVAALNFCARPPQRLIPRGVIEAIELPPGSPPRQRWLRLEEIQRLLDAAGDMRRGSKLTRCERFLWIALETGARKTAIMDLEWSRVDFEVGVIDFALPGQSVSMKGRTSVAISKALLPVLERAYLERTNKLVMTNQGAVWKSIQLAAIHAGFGRQKVRRGAKPRGTGISPHTLRHTAATMMARRGVPLWIIAKCLGNSVEMIERVYGHWAPAASEVSTDLISGGELRQPK